MTRRAIIVHSLAEARAAVAAAAELGVPLTLASAPGAAGTTGAAWFRELVALAASGHPETPVTAVLDCGDKPGHVLAALRQGLRAVRFTGRKSTAARLAQIAAHYGAEVITGPVQAVDLLDDPEPEAACRRWLSGG
jgi:fructose/tagatose bisphosphate aldolase